MNIIRKLQFRYLPCLIYLRKANSVKHHWFCYTWIKNHIKLSCDNKFEDLTINRGIDLNNTVFIYWKQGWNNIPPIVEKCQQSVKQYLNNHPIILLDENNVYEYVSFPDYILDHRKKGIINEPLFSDLLRLNLLIKYGGYWCDATCYFSGKIPDWIEEADFFMYNSSLLSENLSPIKCSSWFIKSSKDNILLTYVRNFLYGYFKKYDFVIHYYIFHLSFAVFVNEDKDCENIWNNKLYLDNMSPHIMQFSLDKKYTPTLFKHITQQSFIHKLTYKKTILDKESIYQHLLSK